MTTRTYEEHFDEDGRQTATLPDAWIKPSKRFKPGDRIRWLKSQSVYAGPHPAPDGAIPPEMFRDLRGEVGTVLDVRGGHRVYPRQWWSEEHECWVTDSAGWLVVRFPFDAYGVEADGVTAKPRACNAYAEGIEWERVETHAARTRRQPTKNGGRDDGR